MTDTDTPQKTSDTEGQIVDSEPCDTCDGSGATGSGRSFEFCPDCINIPDSVIPDDLPEDPHARIEELKAEKAEQRRQQEQINEVVEKINEAREVIGEAAEVDVVNEETAAVFDHLSSQLGREIQPFRKRKRPVREHDYDSRVYELQQFVDLLERRQGAEDHQDGSSNGGD